MNKRSDPFQKLDLPKRYEILSRRTLSAGLSLENVVEKVEAASNRVEILLRQVQTGGLGRFEVFYGESGSGKTTFLETLPTFFEGVTVLKLDRSVALLDVPSFIRERRRQSDGSTLLYFSDYDNPRFDSDTLSEFLDELRILFREEVGNVVIIWPITDEAKAVNIADLASDIGRDSLIDLEIGGLYRFVGLEESKYYSVADITVRSLTGGTSLESFGLNKEIGEELARVSNTVSEFFSKLETKSAELNDYYRDLLEEKVLPRIWIILAGDSTKDLDLTIGKLTQGINNKPDIDTLLEYLDNPALDTAYVKDWRPLRGRMAHLMDILDVRVIELPPNVALAAVRAYGDADAQKPLNLKTTTTKIATDTLKRWKAYRFMTTGSSTNTLLKPNKQETINEFVRLQKTAGKGDKKLNNALGKCLKVALTDDSFKDAEIHTEQKDVTTGKLPDIRITGLPSDRPIHLEITWRTTGLGVEGELKKRQNTLTPGHVRVYLLEKVLGWVHALGLTGRGT